MIVPRWEWRSFGDDFGPAGERLASLPAASVENSDEVYLLSHQSDASVKVRDGQMDIKHLLAVNRQGLEKWVPVLKASFPVAADDVRSVLSTLRASPRPLERASYTARELIDDVEGDDVLAVDVHKRRERYRLDGVMAELTEVRTATRSTRTLAVECEDPARVASVVAALGLDSRPVACMARGLGALVGFGIRRRYAVIDVGTNSVKLHIGELTPDGGRRTFADRAEVTRLGDGLGDAGALQPAAIERTVGAIAAMAGEARRDGAERIVAVGTAGLRIAPNAGDLIDAVEQRCGVRVQVISAEEEARLAYLASASSLGGAHGSLVVFDTGGGSSQFTFGDPGHVEERFSVNVGAVGITDRYGLAGAVTDDQLVAALAGVAAGLGRLEGRQRPDTLVGMGGAVTNLAAVERGLATYDPARIDGSSLAIGEIDRQIERYRRCDAEERRSIRGLQPNRAEVILAGACIVRQVLSLLGTESLIVSDRGLRHGLAAESFPSGAP